MDSDDENDYQPSWRGVPGIVILINVFENSKHNIFEIAQIATCRLLKQHMRSSSSHHIAVCLYGSEESSTSKFDVKPVTEIIPLSVPTLEDFKKFKNMTKTSFTEAKEFKLSDVLWHSSKMFLNCKKQLSSRSVIMLTRFDIAPVVLDQKPTLNRASDLIDSNIDIRVINISDQQYVIDTFYEKFLKIANRGMDYVVPKPISSPIEIEKLMHQESHRHSAVAKLNFEICKDFNIGVGIYNLLKRPGQNNKKNVYLDRESNAVVTSVTKTVKVSIDATEIDEDNSQPKEVPLIKSELLYYQEFGGERIEFTDKEMKTIKNPFGPPMMKLLGFKPARIICKEKWYLKMGHFLFPNEKTIEGSTVACKALHKACADMEMVAICILCTRVNAKPVVVALSPCVRPLNLDVDVGFDIIHIPFVESVRDVNINEDEDNVESSVVCIEQAHKSLMKDILNELTVEYKPDMFEDPKLQSKYRALEAIALDEEDNDPFVDTTIPNPERFENIRDDLFEELFGPFGDMSLKRTAEKQASNGGKKQKVEDIDEDLLDLRLKSKKLNDYSVAQLRQILRFKQIKGLTGLTGLKKRELVNLVYEHCVSQDK
ncbi:X-ray repair cross-complementing protein 6 [Maniola jurtina]|uniref:X-ray repair cross-complementing protein 6 n=1 Tax=Maniola jurtina TaxID=191418 RepID=UPI001E68F356|nr:X-ray repair cross-complementing protein 6 [Maniola jurtina]